MTEHLATSSTNSLQELAPEDMRIDSVEETMVESLEPNTSGSELLIEKDAIFQYQASGHTKSILKKIPHVGLLMAVTSSLFFSICSLIVRIVQSVSPLEHSTIRFIGVFLPSLCVVVYKSENPLGESGSRFILFLRGVLGSAGLIFHFYAIQQMPLADASVIIFSAPIFVTIFARIFLKEPCSPAHIGSIITTIIGVILISRPPFLFNTSDHGYSAPNMLGSLYALSGTICSANVYILIRKLRALHYAVIMATFATIGISMSQTLSIVIDSTCIPCPWWDRLYLLLLGVFSFFGQVLLTKSLQIEQAGPVSICRTADIVFAFAWQVIFLGEVPKILSVVGAVLVSSSVVVMGLRKWVLEAPINSRCRKKLWFLI